MFQGLIANETLGYFMARTYLFFKHIGLDMNRVRFRQHMSNEMAHYASECWDAECKTSYVSVETRLHQPTLGLCQRPGAVCLYPPLRSRASHCFV